MGQTQFFWFRRQRSVSNFPEQALMQKVSGMCMQSLSAKNIAMPMGGQQIDRKGRFHPISSMNRRRATGTLLYLLLAIAVPDPVESHDHDEVFDFLASSLSNSPQTGENVLSLGAR